MFVSQLKGFVTMSAAALAAAFLYALPARAGA
jgi:hypothetical protein